MRRAVLSLPLLAAFALLKGCGGGDADDSSTGAGAGGAAGVAGSAAGKGGAAGNAGSSGDAGTSGGAAAAGSSGAAGAGGITSCGGAWAAIPGVPKDWVPFSTPDCHCTFYAPPPGGSAAPFDWEPCGDDAPQGVVCSRLRTNVGGTASKIYGARWVAPGGVEVLREFPPGSSTNVDFAPGVEFAFGALDGSPTWSIIGPYRPSCQPVPEPASDGRYAIGTANKESGTHGVIAGTIGAAPQITRSGLPDVTGLSSGWGASSSYVFRDAPGSIWASAWAPEDGEKIFDPSMDPDGLPGFIHLVNGGDAFLDVSASGHTGFLSWTKQSGLRQLLRTPHDNTRGFMHLGSDGKDMAFTYGEAATAQYEFSRRALFTAPYTTDPAVLKATAKPLTAIPRISAPFRWGVGCGHAVAGAADVADGVSLVVVRLSDGAWWRKWPKDPQGSGGIQALGATCEELVVLAGKQGLPTRIRLDSLGEPSPPIPPDIQQPPF